MSLKYAAIRCRQSGARADRDYSARNRQTATPRPSKRNATEQRHLLRRANFMDGLHAIDLQRTFSRECSFFNPEQAQPGLESVARRATSALCFVLSKNVQDLHRTQRQATLLKEQDRSQCFYHTCMITSMLRNLAHGFAPRWLQEPAI